MTDQNREKWLNDYLREGLRVLYGNGFYCAGCGQFTGDIVTISIDESYVSPPIPDWPFNEDTCPVCSIKDGEYVREITAEDLIDLPVSILRKALIKAKVKK